MMRVDNVEDSRRSWVGSWESEPLDYGKLGPADVGRSVIYRSARKREVGVISSYRGGLVFVRYTRGSTGAATHPRDLVFGVRPLDGPGS